MHGKISYRGPISPITGGWPRIKLDLTADECIVLTPVHVPIFHPYTDAPDDGITVQCYAYEEAFGEKVRALAERTRPRDLYDVINLYRNTEVRPSPSVLLDVLRQKCEFKGTSQVFTPRYAVELTPSGPISIPPNERRSSSGGSYSGFGEYRAPRLKRRPARRSTPRGFSTSLSSGPTYVYECTYCHKKFRRKKQSSTLNPHKTPDGWDCPGRTGYLVDTKY